MSAADYIRILPEIVLTVFGMLVMLVDPLLPEHNDRKGLGVLALVGSLLAIVATLFQSGHAGTAWFGMIQVDSFSVFFHLIVGFVASTVILASFEYLAVQRIRLGEYYGLILLGSVGMMLMREHRLGAGERHAGIDRFADAADPQSFLDVATLEHE